MATARKSTRGRAASDPKPSTIPTDPPVSTPAPQVAQAPVLDPENSQADPWPELSELFGDGEAAVRVELYRVSPKFLGDVPINGYLERLTPESCNFEYVKTQYGGGKFRVIKRHGAGGSGDFLGQYYFDIAGPPKQPSIAPAAAALVSATDPPAAAPAAIASYEGLPITGDLKRDMETIKSVVVFKELLRSGDNDLNKELLQVLLADRRPAQDSLAVLRDLGPTLAALRELMPGSGEGESSGSTGFNDIIKTALQTFGEYLKTARAVPRAANPAALAPGSAPRLLPADPPAPAAPGADQNIKLESEDPPAPEVSTMPLSPQAMIDSAVQAIVQNYRLGKPPERVVDFLNNRIPLNKALRNEYLAHRREELFDMAEMLVDDQDENYSSDQSARAKFADFWKVVFDKFLESGGE